MIWLKPRLRKMRFVMTGWCCRTSGATGFGATAKEAYDDWKKEAEEFGYLVRAQKIEGVKT